MGKIFTTEEIRQNRIPKMDSFLKSKRILLDGMSVLHEEGLVAGAKVYGSVSRIPENQEIRLNGGLDGPSIRSDMDYLVVLNSTQAIEPTRRLLTEIQAVHDVPTDGLILLREDAERGHHNLDFILTSISRLSMEGNGVGEDPSNIVKAREITPEDAYRRYIYFKTVSLLSRAVSPRESDRLHGLRRALEAHNIVRKTLDASTRIFEDDPPNDDTKAEVIRTFRASREGSPLVQRFDYLVEANSDYDKLLRDTLNGRRALEDYQAELDDMARTVIPVACDWTNELTMDFESRMEMGLQTPEGIRRMSKER